MKEEIIEEIINAFREVLGIEKVTENTQFFENGGDSFDAIRLLELLNKGITVVDIFENPTPKFLAKHILKGMINNQMRLVHLNGNENKNNIKIICIPYGGGNPTIYRDLFKNYPNVDIYSIDIPKVRYSSIENFTEEINVIINNMRKFYNNKVVIYGHCAGAATAVYITHQLQQYVERLYLVIGASMPVENFTEAILTADLTSNDEWRKYLKTLGGLKNLSDSQTEKMLITGRRDHFISNKLYEILEKKVICNIPTLLLFGEEDSSIPDKNLALESWKRFLKNVNTSIIVEGNHYFICDKTKEIETEIQKFIGTGGYHG